MFAAAAAAIVLVTILTSGPASANGAAESASAEPMEAPRPPAVSISSMNGAIEVTWEDPGPSSEVTEYRYRLKTDSSPWSNWMTLPGTARRLTLIDLAPGAIHHLSMQAVNAAGWSAITLVPLVSVPPPPGNRFSDDDGNTHEGAIEAIAAARITLGCQERLYCPDEEASRGQFASLLARAFPDLIPDNARDFFSDDDASVHEDAINRLTAAGIAAACASGQFCPDDHLTRAQMATLLARALPAMPPPPNPRDHFSDDDGTASEIAINFLASNGIVDGCGPGRFCPDDHLTRAQMATLLARALNLETSPPRPSPWRFELVVDGIPRLDGATDLQAPVGDYRAFLTLKRGTILIIADGAFMPEPFLDLTHKVRQPTGSGAGEQGLLGLAFHPNYVANRKFYVFYTDLDGHSQVYEYRADPDDPNRADPSTARHIITFEQECKNHNGGQLQFGNDGYLYMSVGDGGCGWPGADLARDPHTELGTIVRIDVDNGDPYSIPADNPFADGRLGSPEVWAYGLRNPWRFSFDDSHIYVSDVGDTSWEEINIADASQSGINYGWNTMEGADCYFATVPPCDWAGLFIPQVTYSHSEGVSTIGGYVYRGTAIPEMTGRYFYTDYSAEWIRTFFYDNGEVTEHYHWNPSAVGVPENANVWSFGKDGHGELYLLTRWSVYKIVPW